MTQTERPPTVLVVDDEVAIRRGLRTFLEMAGFRVVEAIDVAGGVAASEREQPDFVVLDLRLPDGSGFKILEAIRERRREPSPRVYVFTGVGTFDDGLNAVRLGADAVMQKSDGGIRLLETIWRVAELPSSLMEGPARGQA